MVSISGTVESEILLPAVVLAPFVAAVLTLGLGRSTGTRVGIVMVLAAISSFVLTLRLAFHAVAAEPLVFHRDWIPFLNIDLRFRGDAFGLFFALLISGIGALVGAYSLAYLPRLDGARIGRYYAALAAFMGAMLGIALSDDLILLFVFWEITSVTSFLLIGFWYEEEAARSGAMTALLVTALGGLAMMAGFVLVGIASGTFTISELIHDAALRKALAESPLFVPALVLILIGAFTKSAQAPFHFWLPGAMVAPTPVSTYLHAATMVKAGIFLLGRLAPMFADSGIWAPALVAFGLATFFLGAWQAFRETDLKLMLARTTVSTLGLVTMLYGLGAADQDALQVLSHAAYKGALFLVVGIVEHVARTRDLRQLGGLRIELPLTFLACAGAALSMAGLPPFLGFLAKEALYGALLESPMLQSAVLVRELVVVATVVANAFLFAVAFRILTGIFLGARAKIPIGPDGHRAVSRTPRLVPGHAPEEAHGESLLLWLPPLFLAALALGMGLLAATPVMGDLVSRFSSDPSAHLRVSLVPAHAGPFLLSLVTIALGVLLYQRRETVERLQRRLAAPTSMQSLWNSALERVTDFAMAFSSFWQSGSLRWYFSGILGFFVLITLVALGRGGLSIGEASAGFGNLTWYEPLLCALMAASAVAVVRAQTRLAATIALTSNGFLVALMYVVYRSPDILLTQILIETVSTIFVLLVLFFMPVFRKDGPSPARTAQNGGIAAAVGVVMFLFVVLCTSPGFKETNTIAADYLSRSLAEAGGQNAVNVIIVDFRAMDTQGEITVLVVVGLCVYGVLRSRRRTA